MTEDCLIPFGAKLPSPPELLPLGFLWNYEGSQLQLCLTFTVDMDTTFAPSPSDLDLLVDAVPKTIDSIAWLNNRVLQILYDEAALGPSVIRLSLPESVAAFHAADLCPVSPFDQLGIEQAPTAEWEAAAADFNILTDFAFNVKQGASLEVIPWRITFAAFDGTPDFVSALDPQRIILKINDENPPSGTLEMELLNVSTDYKTITGIHLCPFTIENIQEAP